MCSTWPGVGGDENDKQVRGTYIVASASMRIELLPGRLWELRIMMGIGTGGSGRER